MTDEELISYLRRSSVGYTHPMRLAADRIESLLAEVARLTRVIQMQPTRPQDTLLPQIDLTGCKVCGVRGVMGYVCPRPDCPTAVRATS